MQHTTHPLHPFFRLACVLLLALSFWDCSGCCKETEFIAPAETTKQAKTTASALKSGECKATPDCALDQVCKKGACVAAKSKKPTPTRPQDDAQKKAPKFTPEEDAAVGTECAKSTDCSGELICGAKGCEKPPECTQDSQCPKGLTCDTTMQLCRKPICFRDNDCSDGVCVYGQCETEAPGCRGADCPDDHFCIPETGECEPKNCKSDDDCSTGRYCGGSHCRECQSDGHCAPGQVCEKVDGICQEPETCTADENCLANRVCDTSTGKCEQGPCGEDRFTGNHSRKSAAVLPEGAQELSLCSGKDDWFAVELVQGDGFALHISREHVQHSGMEIRVYEPDRESELSRWTDKFSSGRFTGVLENAPETGTYHIRLKHRWGDNIDYTLRVDIIPGGRCINDITEPNDTYQNADPNRLNNPKVLRICPGEQDWFVGRAKTGDLLEVSVEVLQDPVPGLAFYRSIAGGQPELIDSTSSGEKRKMTLNVAAPPVGSGASQDGKEVEQLFYVRVFHDDPEEDNEYRLLFLNRSTMVQDIPESNVPPTPENVEIKDL